MWQGQWRTGVALEGRAGDVVGSGCCRGLEMLDAVQSTSSMPQSLIV